MRLAASVLLAALALPPAVLADGAEIDGLGIDAKGYPSLQGGYSPDYALARPNWRICSPDCGPVVSVSEFFETGPVPPGTTIELSTTFRGRTTTDRTPPWRGIVQNTASPTFTGAAQIGSRLTPRKGTWSGGFGDEFSLVGMQACLTPAMLDCRALTASSFQPGNPESVELDAAYAGWYVGAVEARFGGGSAFTLPGYGFPPGVLSFYDAPRVSQTVAAGPLVGPVPPPTDAQRPTVSWRSRAAVRRRGLADFGTARCPVACGLKLTVKARSGGKTRTRFANLGGTGTVRLRLPLPPRMRSAAAFRATLAADALAFNASARVRGR